MKKILGLDLGVSSIGWANVMEAENENERSKIINLGVRINPLTVDEQTNFEKGKSITTNADRTLKRSMRRNLQRYKLRKDSLISLLKLNNIISENTLLSEQGNACVFETYRLRAKSATEQIPLDSFARVLLMINKKRGYKSSRKVNSLESGSLIDGMSVAVHLYENNLTPGEYVWQNIFSVGKKQIPEFYISDLCSEFDRIWNFQKNFYLDVFTDDLKVKIDGKTKTLTSKIFLASNKIYLAENKSKAIIKKDDS